MKTLPMMSFGEAVKTCFKKYVTFSGRARRSEYWWFALLSIILGVCSTLLVNWKLGRQSELESQIVEAAFDQDKYNALLAQAESVDNTFFPLILLIGIVALILLLPTLAACVRRLHDTGRSGWIVLLNFVPVVNIVTGILTLIWTIQDSKPEENQFGSSPKYVEEAVPAAE